MRHVDCSRGMAQSEASLFKSWGLPPSLYFRPKFRQGSLLETTTNIDCKISLQRIRIVGCASYVFDAGPELLESLLIVVQDDHAITGVSARSPEEPGLVTAQRGRKAVLGSEKINGASLSVVLREDAAVISFVRRNPAPS